MSFSSNVKAEICKTTPLQKSFAVAEAYGILLYANTFTHKEIKIMTKSRPFGVRLIAIFEKAFDIQFDVLPKGGEAGMRSYEIHDREKLKKIFSDFGYDDAEILSHNINLGVLEGEDKVQAFIRGAFLSGGSVTTPWKMYHLELSTGHLKVNLSMYAMLLDLGFSPKYIMRKGNYVIYFKQCSAIEDFLTTLGAPLSAMEMMNAAAEKAMRNSVQRKVNCDTANVDKVINAAQKQLDAIRKIEENSGLDSLEEKLRETAWLRVRHPEATMTELGFKFKTPVSKSCVCHRLKKLIDISEL